MALTKRESAMTDLEWFVYRTVPFWFIVAVQSTLLIGVLACLYKVITK